MKFAKVCEGYYVNEDKTISISRWQSYVNRVKQGLGKGYNVEYTARLLGSEIARGKTLVECKTRIALYLADRDAGILGRRHKYGFLGDQSVSPQK